MPTPDKPAQQGLENESGILPAVADFQSRTFRALHASPLLEMSGLEAVQSQIHPTLNFKPMPLLTFAVTFHNLLWSIYLEQLQSI
jgi:hypothetical protein